MFSWLRWPTFVLDEARQKLESDVQLPKILHPAPFVPSQKSAQRQCEIFVVEEDFPHVMLFIPDGFEDYSRESIFRCAEVMNCLESVETVRRPWMRILGSSTGVRRPPAH